MRHLTRHMAAVLLPVFIAFGCPAAQGQNIVGIPTVINFDFDSALLRPDSLQRLERVINLLQANEGINVKMVGYTDSTGPASYNQTLSVRRAISVQDYIAANGINLARLSHQGEGESEPLVGNNTISGRAANRRVEFDVVE